MDFIERWLGVAPDGGNGAFELALMMVCACAALAAVLWRGRFAGLVLRSGELARAVVHCRQRPSGRP